MQHNQEPLLVLKATRKLKGPKNDLVGKKFGKLTVVGYFHKKTETKCNILWNCECECGGKSQVETSNLTTGHTTACGCEKWKGNNRTHGQRGSRLYRIWSLMKDRCSNPNTPAYVSYGGRGISCCNEWLTFENFQEWANQNGYVENLTIERINVNGNYCPENCEWIPQKDQTRNRRVSLFFEVDEKTQYLKDIAKEHNIPYHALYLRITRQGMSIEDAVKKPLGPKLHTLNGISKNLKQWGEELGISYKKLHARINAGWTFEQAISKP